MFVGARSGFVNTVTSVTLLFEASESGNPARRLGTNVTVINAYLVGFELEAVQLPASHLAGCHSHRL